MERPLAVLGFSFFLALTLGTLLTLNLTLALAALCLLALLVGLCLRPLRNNGRLMAALLAALAAFSILGAKEALVFRPLQQWDGKTVHLKLEALNYSTDPDDRIGIGVRVLEGDLPAGTKLALNAGAWGIDCEPYDLLEGEFVVSALQEAGSERIYDYAKSLGILLNIAPAGYDAEESVAVTAPETRPLMARVLALRRAARMAVTSQPVLNGPGLEEVRGVTAGLAFGFKDGISAATNRMFRSLGVSHLLAVSGLHTALLAQALLALLRFFRLPRKASSLLTAGFVLLFVALTGFTPSAVRAGVMSMVMLVGLLFGREPDSLNSLGLALLVITLPNPYAVCDVGLLLSAAATFGILVLHPPMKRATADRLKEKGGAPALLARPVNAVMVTLAATLPTLPVTLAVFGTISLVSPLANLLMVPLSSVITVTGCLGAFLGVAGVPVLTGWVFWVGKTAARLLLWVGEALYALPAVSSDADRLFLLVGIPAGLGLVLLGHRLLGRRGARTAALWSVIALCGGILANGVFMRGVTTLTVLPARGATAALVERDGRAGLILMGGEDAAEAASYVLRGRSLSSVDFLLIADPDDGSAFSSPLVTEVVGVECLITAKEGAYRLTLEALPVQDGAFYLDEGAVAFWGDCSAERLEDGFLRLTVGSTRLLFCPEGGNAAALTADQRRTNLAVFTGSAPRNVSALTLQAGVLSVDEEMLPYAEKGVPRGIYPVENTAREAVAVRTRGMGDVAFSRF
ncbi:MAG TPA: ComEC/Rec2 family competence protein [Firmicutes bacterium]|nr:ComEC/Rec2 family competence protein [Bacillota bacterium]